jgi:hypothetical protein
MRNISCHARTTPHHPDGEQRSRILSSHGKAYTREQRERLERIHARVIEARRELDALIGDAYLRPRANIVPVHFLDLASAVEKLRWAEKEWRELDQEVAASADSDHNHDSSVDDDELIEDPEAELLEAQRA